MKKAINNVIDTALMSSLILMIGTSLLAVSSMTSNNFQADAATCSSSFHCYAVEAKDLTTYGNQHNPTVTQLTLPSYCSNLSTVEEWINFPNGFWTEMGYYVGNIANLC